MKSCRGSRLVLQRLKADNVTDHNLPAQQTPHRRNDGGQRIPVDALRPFWGGDAIDDVLSDGIAQPDCLSLNIQRSNAMLVHQRHEIPGDFSHGIA